MAMKPPCLSGSRDQDRSAKRRVGVDHPRDAPGYLSAKLRKPFHSLTFFFSMVG